MLPDLKAWAQELRRDTLALWLAVGDKRTPLGAKLVAGAVVAYAFSPIDLTPDFIPVLGLLDDLLIVPLGIWLALKLVPAPLMAELRIDSARIVEKPVSRTGAALIAALWIASLALIALLFLR
ncbi:MAG: YkvA family protein [Qipengyuania sp.]